MKRFTLSLLILFGTMLPSFAQIPSSVLPSKSLPEWQFGYAMVYAVQDRASEMAAGIFPDAKAIFDQSVPGGKAPSSISTFLIRVPASGGKDVYILVDTGLGGGSSELLANLKKKIGYGDGITPEDISFVLLTHLHGDHIGGLLDGDKRQFPNAKVLCGKVEYDYWIGQDNAQVNKIKSVYGDDFRGEFAFDEFLLLGNDSKMLTIKTVDARGHTPGHTAFLLESAGQKLMIVGDLVHAAAVQFAHPEVCARYDMDAKQAIESRKRLLDMAAEENIPIAGMHLPGTGFALIKKNDSGGYQHTLVNLPPASLHFSRGQNGVSVSCWYAEVGQFLPNQPSEVEAALTWLEAELKNKRTSVIALYDSDKLAYTYKDAQKEHGEKFLEKIKQLSQQYQVPYSMEHARSNFPGSPVEYHFPKD